MISVVGAAAETRRSTVFTLSAAWAMVIGWPVATEAAVWSGEEKGSSVTRGAWPSRHSADA
jgi:hypothetical protein